MKTTTAHEWEPTDSQGYSMQCSRCGESIYIEHPSWDEKIDAPCRGQEGA